MITQYGMSEKFGLMGLATQQNQYLDGRVMLNCGDQTATEIDHEVMELLKRSYEEALTLLKAHRTTLDRIAEYLIEQETITGKEFMKIFRECEGIPEEKPEEISEKTASGAPGVISEESAEKPSAENFEESAEKLSAENSAESAEKPLAESSAESVEKLSVESSAESAGTEGAVEKEI
jgi:cell division protease FtsH